MTFISETSPDQDTWISLSLFLMAACISIRCMFHGLSTTSPPARHMSPTPQGTLLFFIFGCAGWVFVTECRLSLVAASRGYSLVAVRRLLVAVASLVAELGL